MYDILVEENYDNLMQGQVLNSVNTYPELNTDWPFFCAFQVLLRMRMTCTMYLILPILLFTARTC